MSFIFARSPHLPPSLLTHTLCWNAQDQDASTTAGIKMAEAIIERISGKSKTASLAHPGKAIIAIEAGGGDDAGDGGGGGVGDGGDGHGDDGHGGAGAGGARKKKRLDDVEGEKEGFSDDDEQDDKRPGKKEKTRKKARPGSAKDELHYYGEKSNSKGTLPFLRRLSFFFFCVACD